MHTELELEKGRYEHLAPKLLHVDALRCKHQVRGSALADSDLGTGGAHHDIAEDEDTELVRPDQDWERIHTNAIYAGMRERAPERYTDQGQSCIAPLGVPSPWTCEAPWRPQMTQVLTHTPKGDRSPYHGNRCPR